MRSSRIRQLLLLLLLVAVGFVALQFWDQERPAKVAPPPGPPPAIRPVAPGPMPAPVASPAAVSGAEMHVYFFYPDRSERYMGTTHGTDGCLRVAGNYAAALKLTDISGWFYGCCADRNSPDCKKKLR